MARKLLPLLVQNDAEPQKSWAGISNPNDLARYIASVLSVDAESFDALNEIIISSTEPTGEDRNKIWIKTDEPVGIGIPIGSTYRVISDKPINIPYLHIGSIETIPSYARRLGSTELSNYKLDAPDNSIASWVIISQ